MLSLVQHGSSGWPLGRSDAQVARRLAAVGLVKRTRVGNVNLWALTSRGIAALDRDGERGAR